jgi:hypothetical protein
MVRVFGYQLIIQLLNGVDVLRQSAHIAIELFVVGKEKHFAACCDLCLAGSLQKLKWTAVQEGNMSLNVSCDCNQGTTLTRVFYTTVVLRIHGLRATYRYQQNPHTQR